MTNSRNKGAAFERTVAAELFDLTGVRFSRNLEQYRAADNGDLNPDDADFPFLIECKNYAAPKSCQQAWKDQATSAAARVGKIPAVVYKLMRQPIKVAVPFTAFGGSADEWAEITLPGLAYLASELMAEGKV